MVATCIILHKNWLVASGVGVVVAAYISFTEYYLANNDIRNFVIHETFMIFSQTYFLNPRIPGPSYPLKYPENVIFANKVLMAILLIICSV